MPGPQRILLADGDAVLRAALAGELAREGYAVVDAATADDARAAARSALPAFAIIDEDLPGGGRALAEMLKADGLSAPILFLTRGETGADRVARPFRFSALLARLGMRAPEGAVRIGPYVFHHAAKMLEAEGRKVRLTEKEANILRFLHASAGTVARDTLLHEVWGYGPAVATHTLETHIYRLRKKIEANPGKAEILLTEEGGYRLSA